jgi:hypothetical protein
MQVLLLGEDFSVRIACTQTIAVMDTPSVRVLQPLLFVCPTQPDLCSSNKLNPCVPLRLSAEIRDFPPASWKLLV